MTAIRLFAFYGSLRRGMANYRLYAPHLHYLTTLQLPGYRLFALSDYPYAIRTTTADTIVAELFHIESQTVREEIYHMEIDAGYVFETITVGDRQAGIYLFPHQGNGYFVPSGDWVAFVGKKMDF